MTPETPEQTNERFGKKAYYVCREPDDPSWNNLRDRERLYWCEVASAVLEAAARSDAEKGMVLMPIQILKNAVPTGASWPEDREEAKAKLQELIDAWEGRKG